MFLVMDVSEAVSPWSEPSQHKITNALFVDLNKIYTTDNLYTTVKFNALIIYYYRMPMLYRIMALC